MIAWWVTSTCLASPYDDIHRTNTRKIAVYRHMETALMMRATLLTVPMRSAMVAERTRLLKAPEADEARFVASMSQAAEGVVEVIFAADSSLERHPLFGVADDRWTIRAMADGAELVFQSAERIDDPTPLQVTLFPQLNRWSELWIVRFEQPAVRASTLTLTVASGFGNGEAVWENPDW